MILSISRAVNILLSALDQDAAVPGLHIEFSGTKRPMQLDKNSVSSLVRTMLKRMDYSAVNMVFPFQKGYIDQQGLKEIQV